MNNTTVSESSPVPWKTSDVLLGLVLVVVATLVSGIIFVAIGGDPNSGLALTVIATTIYSLMFLITWVVGPLRHGTPLGSLGLKRPASMGYFRIFLFLLLVLGLFFVLIAIYAGLLSLLGWDLPDSLPEDLDLGGPVVTASFALVVVLWGPIAEEIFFRGFVFPGLTGRWGVLAAAALSSLLFAVFHVDPRLILPFFAIGMLLVWFYRKTESLWSCIVAHSIWNTVALSVTLAT